MPNVSQKVFFIIKYEQFITKVRPIVNQVVNLSYQLPTSKMSLNLLIIEDDPSFVLEVEMMLEGEREFSIQVASNLLDATKAIKILPDLIILDLRLQESDLGLSLLSEIKETTIPFIVTTAFNDPKFYKTVQEYNPEAYLIKPFDKLTLIGIVDRIFPNEPNDTVRYSYDGVFVKANKKYKKLKFSDINYIKAEGNYCSIFTDEGRVTIRNSLKRFFDRMPQTKFIRIHRSYILNIDAIKSVEFSSNKVFLEKCDLPIGRNYKNEIKKSLLLD